MKAQRDAKHAALLEWENLRPCFIRDSNRGSNWPEAIRRVLDIGEAAIGDDPDTALSKQLSDLIESERELRWKVAVLTAQRDCALSDWAALRQRAEAKGEVSDG